MTFYRYQAKNSEGIIYHKTAEVRSRVELYNLIRQEGGRPISIRESKVVSLAKYVSGMFGSIKTREKIVFARNLSSMIRAGLPVTRALSVMEKQASKARLKRLFLDLAEGVSRGETLSDGMKKKGNTFPQIMIAMVKAGEESGKVAESLDIVSDQMDKAYALTKKVQGAMIYPAVIISVMIVLGILMLIFMVPTLTETFEGIGIELPLATRVVVGMSNFMVAHTMLVIGSILAIAIIAMGFFKSTIGHRFMDTFSIKVPVIGPLLQEVQSARTARTLSSLLSSGVNVVQALSVTIEVMQNHLYKSALEKARAAIEKGEPMSAVFTENSHLYPVFVGEMVAVGEETGKISEMLLGVATFYEEEVNQKTKDLSTIIEPILMVIIGAGVGLFAISMLAPTYSLVDHI
jgi:type IV pilus assembly protein PilC